MSIVYTLLAALFPWLGGYSYADPVITHSGPAELDRLLGFALTMWGRESALTDGGPGTDITIEWGDRTEVNRVEVDWSDWPAGVTLTCNITVNEHLRTWLDDPSALSIIGHEAGHCVGLKHPFEYDIFIDSIMNQATFGWQPVDHEVAAVLYPPEQGAVYTVFVPGIGR